MTLRQWMTETQTGPIALARQLGCSRQTVHAWLERGYVPRVALLIKIAEVTGGQVQTRDFLRVSHG